MRLKITLAYVVAFLAFSMLFSQLHEMAHIAIGRWVCGQWGHQIDFNIWILAEGCLEHNPLAVWSSLAGPIFTYVMIAWGMYLLFSKNNWFQLLGFTLVLVNKPFARLFTVSMGGGDENVALRLILENQLHPMAIKALAFLMVFGLTIPAFWLLYKTLSQAHKLWIIVGFSILPLVFQFIYQFKLLKHLINQGVGSQVRFMGIPDFIHWHTLIVLLIGLTCGFLVNRNQPQLQST